ncbi:hypothetical protein [Lutibacter citreus]|uniref:hypothetical protein n=1 Tax=Lutibacter citreus TaxID=2138210 RepID=UPI000DBE077B|nr:hypothetical protein [Lutibacter citreus]
MIKFFQKIRQRLFTENKFSKYLIYAIGEIILVVLGILIALQIDNWNEIKNEKARLNSILSIVKEDLIKDTLKISGQIELLELRNTTLLKILERENLQSSLDSITKLNYKNYYSIPIVIAGFEIYQMQHKGVELLKSISVNSNLEKDTLISSIIDNHSKYKLFFDGDMELLSKLEFQNILEFERHSWYTDWLSFKYNKDMFQYFYDDEYKRKVGTFKIYIRQFLRDLKNYKRDAKIYIVKIEEKLKK